LTLQAYCIILRTARSRQNPNQRAATRNILTLRNGYIR
jgi:hypothetical protein